MPRLKQALTLAGIVLVAAWVAYFAPRLGPFAGMENDLADLRVAILNPTRPIHPDIVIATVAESTFAYLRQRTPTNRAFLADLIAALDAAGVRAIGIDLFFGETTNPEDDRRLLDALNAVQVPTVLAWADSVSAPGLIAPWQEELWRAFLAEIDNPNVTTGLSVLLRDPRDQVVRSLFIARPNPDGTLDAGFAAALGAALQVPPPSLAPIPLDYYGRPRQNQPSFLQIPAESINPAVAVLWERVQPLLENRIVLVGLDVPRQDRHPTPFALVPDQRDGMAGVVVHAHGLAQLLDRREAAAHPSWLAIAIAILAAVAGALAVRATGAIWLKVVLLFAGPLSILGLGFAVFAWAHLMPHILAPSVGYVLAFVMTEFAMEAYHRREIRLLGGAFARYLSPSVISQLRRDPRRLQLGGEEREITVVITDLSGSVALGESMLADRFVRLLNGYLDGISRVVLAHDGTIDKFIGDAVLALFGAPAEQSDHAVRAVRCARDIDAFARRYVAEQKARGIALGRTRIGVHTDKAVVGNFGGEARFDYTAIGRVTNVCARLEEANKVLGTSVCVSAATVAKCPGVRFRPIGPLALRGVAEPVTAYSPVGLAGEADPDRYGRAYALLASASEQAEAAFAALAETHPHDPLVALHLSRLRSGETGVTIGLQ